MKEQATQEQIEQIFNLFGNCTTMYECNTLTEIWNNWQKSDETLTEWIATWLRVEDASGTPIAMIAEIEKRLNEAGFISSTRYSELNTELEANNAYWAKVEKIQRYIVANDYAVNYTVLCSEFGQDFVQDVIDKRILEIDRVTKAVTIRPLY